MTRRSRGGAYDAPQTIPLTKPMHDVPLASTAPPLGGRRTLSPTAWRPLALGVPAPGLISLLVVLLLAAWVGYAATERRLGILEPDRIVAIDDFPELSGIAYLPGSGTLLGVGDNGEIAEISLEGKGAAQASACES
ncbi:MAG: hypothetical protein M5R42_20065 [Rhodocyclaceae bacterium]|nr:hypothetical protein [Rhodocyclaceae bacterium]